MVSLRNFLVAIFMATTVIALPATTTTESEVLLARKPQAHVRRQQPAPSMARRGLQKRKSNEPTSYIPGNKKDFSAFLCPSATISPSSSSTQSSALAASPRKACPLPGVGVAGDLVQGLTGDTLALQLDDVADWFRIGFQCVDFQTDLKNCGGCSSFYKGSDCTAIPHTARGTCVQGTCQVLACSPGHVMSPDKDACIPRGDAQHMGWEDDDWIKEEERLLRESDRQKVFRRMR